MLRRWQRELMAEDYREYVAATCACGCYVRRDHYCFAGPVKGLTIEQWQTNGRKGKPLDREGGPIK